MVRVAVVGGGCLAMNLDLKGKIHLLGFPFKPLGFCRTGCDSHPAQGRQELPSR